jgi:8-amino-7-oxononanoate synthase
MSQDPLAWLEEALQRLSAAGLRREPACRAGPQRPDGVELGGRAVVNFGTNDYLGLAAECLSGAVREAVASSGWGSGASPLVTGRGALHAQLEQELACFEGTEAALLFPSGFAANLGAIAALVGRGDVVFCDKKNHASIIDGCRLSGARLQVFPHRDLRRLQRSLGRADGYRRRLIVSDGLFSMDGDLAPVPELAELAEQFGAMLMIDEAHATGVFGPNGRGVCEHLGAEDGVHVRVGTLSKGLGSIGGFVAGSRPLVDWLFHRARPYVYSTAAPEAVAAAALQAIRLVREEPHRRRQLLENARELREALSRQGWNTGDSASQIVPVIVGEPQPTMRIAQALQDRGLFVPGIRPPSVPAGQSLLRISLSYAHTPEHRGRLLEAMQACRDLCPAV